MPILKVDDRVDLNGISISFDYDNSRLEIIDGTYTVYLPLTSSGTVTSA
ncbi:MAG: hypothetical protein ACTSPB_02090 [Candidatus Thorarchaeota archaeon]